MIIFEGQVSVRRTGVGTWVHVGRTEGNFQITFVFVFSCIFMNGWGGLVEAFPFGITDVCSPECVRIPSRGHFT